MLVRVYTFLEELILGIRTSDWVINELIFFNYLFLFLEGIWVVVFARSWENSNSLKEFM